MSKTTSAFAQNITLSLEALRTAVLEKVIKDAERAGRSIPPPHELAIHAEIHYLDESNKPIDFNRVIVTFEE